MPRTAIELSGSKGGRKKIKRNIRQQELGKEKSHAFK